MASISKHAPLPTCFPTITTMDRPRRSARQPIKGPTLITPESPVRVIKRKPATTTANTAEIDPEKQLKILLTSSKSDLVSLEMTVSTSIVLCSYVSMNYV